MNLYKALNDDYREFKLQESMTKSSKTDLKSIRSRRNSRTALKESTEVNVSNEGNSTDVNIVIDNNKVEEPVAPVVEPVAEEVTSKVEEPTEKLPLEEESDKKEDCEVKECGSEEVKESAEDGNKFWSSDFKVGDSLDSDGAGKVEILDLDKGSDYVLVKRESGYQPFVAAWAPSLTDDGKLYWGQGHYFSTEDEAKSYLEDKKLSEGDEGKKVPIHNEITTEEVSDDVVETDSTTDAVSKLNEVIAILNDEGSIDPDKCRELVQGAIDTLVPPTEEVEEVEVEEEPLEECDVKSFNILRMSPSGNLYMIEADKVDNSRVFIVGRNFNSKTNMLDEAEIFDDKDKATSKFRNVLYTVNNSKKGE